MNVPVPVLEVNNLKVYFRNKRKHLFEVHSHIHAVDGVSLKVEFGKTLGLVGESGSGKTLSALSILKLLPINANVNSGSVIFKKKDILKLPINEIEKIRGNKISTIFQEPMSSLNPLHTIDKQIKEIITTHNKRNIEELNKAVLNLLKEVNLEDLMNRPNIYSYELSGGQRQRVMIALSIANNPDLLIADEPTTALDVTIQAQVINLMKDIIKEFNMGVIFITHDLGVIAQVADDVAVMYLGSVVEQGPVNEILKNPMHPYTRGLINALPDINNLDAPLTPIPGNIPSPLDRPSGCVFRTRCPHASQEGKEAEIKMGLVEVKPGHWLDNCGVNCGKV